ncbi:metal-dependent transcriptional regulator [Natronococcus jeotgali]|uniref:DtxR family iron (Metal) dependent repressor n=1 Tax=Natronococcus jeotgali DSM 18795 TaxID=1227498 RepID=L9XRF2_9EURY|nr:metal-dependent transcriptional regulator [Natronococcus jeotgali]ELY63203.1 DtxR family iron (metal) dependent repressor [Natronococcus jeotgali DSM 18795]
MTTVAMEDYLKAIYHGQQETDGRVQTSAVAAHLGVSLPSVSAMFRRLEHRGLVEHQKYRGVTLTAEGQQIAVETVRHCLLLEAYLTKFLDHPDQAAHKEADQLEHHISEKFAEQIRDALDDQ